MKKRLSILVLAAALLAISANLYAGERLWEEKPDAERKPYIDKSFNDGLVKLAQDANPAVVSIFTTKVVKVPFFNMPRDPFLDLFRFFGLNPNKMPRTRALGSGFVISPDGYILTNNHVIENADEILVAFKQGGKEYKATVVGADERLDVAIIKIKPDKPLPVLPLGDSSKLRVGEIVLAIGNPLGLEHTVTMGIVSQIGRKEVHPSPQHQYSNFIQTDASINPGNSGGPLINIYGEVVGINTAIANGQGIGFAIPINMAKKIIPQLVAHGKVERSWLGVQIQELTPELAKSLGIDEPRGALVVDVVKGSPADKAGIRPEDVILSVNGSPVQVAPDLAWLISTAGVGTTVKLKVWRNGKPKTISVTLEAMPQNPSLARADNQPKKLKGKTNLLGIEARNLTRTELRNLPSRIKNGVIVLNVDPNSAAAQAGLSRGDVIMRINGKSIKNMRDFKKAIAKLKKGDIVRMMVYQTQKGSLFFLAFTV